MITDLHALCSPPHLNIYNYFCKVSRGHTLTLRELGNPSARATLAPTRFFFFLRPVNKVARVTIPRRLMYLQRNADVLEIMTPERTRSSLCRGNPSRRDNVFPCKHFT